MLEINQNDFLKQGKYIIGVSGGPDSMCLLYTLFQLGYDLVVCNVNYNTRDVSSLEEKMVKEFCAARGIKFESLSVTYKKNDKNFEGWARDVRYTFFKKMYIKYQASGLFIAHHRNDDLETYILQKNRNNIVRRWGLASFTSIMGMKVYRPFLKYSKKELLEECEKNDIPYSIDVTNFEPICERNKVRIDLIDKYSKEEIDKIFENKDIDNQKIDRQMENIKKYLEYDEWNIDDIKNLTEIEKIRFMYEIIVSRYPGYANKMSRRRIEEYLKALFVPKTNLSIKLSDKEEICKSFGKFKLITKSNNIDYEYIIDRPMKMDTPYFSFDLPNDLKFLKIYEDSYPLKVRNVRINDVVIFGKIPKKMNRIMIDEKIPTYKRSTYPIILDKDNKVVYFPLYKSEKQKNIAQKLNFVVK